MTYRIKFELAIAGKTKTGTCNVNNCGDEGEVFKKLHEKLRKEPGFENFRILHWEQVTKQKGSPENIFEAFGDAFKNFPWANSKSK